MICSKKQSSSAAATATATIAGGKTLRACDSCICRRARWYCAADDAFLCHNCDASVHSANPLARRHHRVRLQPNTNSKLDKLAPSWHHGFKRKARTPRPSIKSKIVGGAAAPPPFVPEIETSAEDGEEQLLYRVPIFDPVLAEFCSPTPVDESNSLEVKPTHQLQNTTKVTNSDTNANSNEFLVGFMQSDAELAEFAADMESLLGRGLDNNSFSMEELGLVDAKYSPEGSEQVKEELDNENSGDVEICEEIDLSRETLEINFDCRSANEEQEETMALAEEEMASEEFRKEKKIGLRLDYEAIAVEWSAQGGSLSPWVNGERPLFGPDNCWLDYMGMWGGGEVQGLVPGAGMGGIHFDEGREARVSRYREKRRTRLFSKKIRYEVRKLNAEKRPRMKGRFVKRASTFAAATGGATAFKY